jgi:hypothetical protein
MRGRQYSPERVQGRVRRHQLHSYVATSLAVFCPAVLKKKVLRFFPTCCSKEEGIQELFPWLFMTVLFKSEKDCGAALFCTFRSKGERPILGYSFSQRIGEGLRSFPAVLKKVLAVALVVHCSAVLEKNWRRISICTCCSKEEGIGELAPALAVHCPAVIEKKWRRISICTCCSKEEGIGELAPGE